MKNFEFDFIKNRNIFFGISISIIVIGIIFNIIFGTQLDIQFTGGAIVKYSYTGEIDENELKDVIQKSTEKTVSFQINDDVKSADGSETKNIISVEFAGNEAISLEQEKIMTDTLLEKFPDNNFEQIESLSVDPSMGKTFFLKCMFAVLLSGLLMVIYVAFRFSKIGGLSAGVMALLALIHDIIMIYFTFIIFRLPLDDNFIAVSLMILGYSLNDTIVIYDRVRENKKLMTAKIDITTLVNKSINQTLRRTINTSISTLIAIGTVLVVAIIFNLSSVISFALPMVVGVISGCYSTISIAGPLWVMWQNRKEKKLIGNKHK